MEVYMSAFQAVLDFQQQTEQDLLLTRGQVNGAGVSVAKTWCDPDKHAPIIGADCGGGKVHYFNLHTEKKDVCNIRKFLEIAPKFGSGTLLIIEHAHLATPRTQKSLAQPYTAEELLRLYRECEASGVTIRLFPHSHTRKARDWVAVNMPQTGVEKGKSTDENDAKGLAYYVKNNNSVALVKPPKDFEITDKRRYGSIVVAKSNDVLNVMRRHGYERGDELINWFDFAFGLSQRAKGQFDFFDEKQSFTLASLVVTEQDGELMSFAYKNQIPGFHFWKTDVLKMSSLHRGGGIARSNTNHHKFRSYIVNYAKNRHGVCLKKGTKRKEFCEYSHTENRIRTACWKHVRDEIKAVYRIAVDMAKDFKRFDVLSSTTV
jgi:hypothetical protein